MHRPLDLAKLQALASDGSYSGQRLLTSLSSVTLLSAATLLQNLDIWQGAGYDLTTSEIDEIDELVSEIIDNLMEEVSPVSGAYEHIATISATSDVTELGSGNLNFSGYDILKIFISGLLSDYTGNYVDGVLMEWENDDTITKYNSFSSLQYQAGTIQYEQIQTIGGILLENCAVADPPNNGYFGNAEITVYHPNAANFLNLAFSAILPGDIAQHNLIVNGVGTYESLVPKQSFKIYPYRGANFLVDPTEPTEPDYLRMSIYGIGQ